VRGALQTLPGVGQVEVDFAKQRVVVSVTGTQTGEKELIATLTQLGYTAFSPRDIKSRTGPGNTL